LFHAIFLSSEFGATKQWAGALYSTMGSLFEKVGSVKPKKAKIGCFGVKFKICNPKNALDEPPKPVATRL
jgi:hypothetical protein